MSPPRAAVFAGTWYPGDKAALEAAIDLDLTPPHPAPRAVLAAIAPHAGVMHSGAVAGAVYREIKVPRCVIILCPNHRDRRARRPLAAVAAHEAWETPLGSIPGDAALAAELVARCALAALDDIAHAEEHAVELQLPFLQRRNPNFSLVAVTIGSVAPAPMLALGAALADLVRAHPETLLVASTDMTHYEPREQVRRKDEQAIARLRALDPEGLLAVCAREGISMCGRGPAAAVIAACKALGAQEARLMRWDCSRPRGPMDPVVGYAGLMVEAAASHEQGS